MTLHVHLIGGGGEGGYATRTPEIQLTDITTSGVTTVLGLLGTDGVTRHVASLLAKLVVLKMKVLQHIFILVLMKFQHQQLQVVYAMILF